MSKQPTANVTSVLDKMSYQELMHLKREVDSLISSRQEDAKAELRKQMEAAVEAAGLSFKDVFGRSGPRKSAAIKYRDPKNPENTWTGRGRKPNWLQAQLEKRNVKVEDFLIQ